MAVQQILNENNQYVSKDFLNPEIEVSQISFSGGQENYVRVGLTGDIEGLASVGVGYQSTTSGDHSVAIGHSASSASRGVCIGHEGEVSGEYGISIGDTASASASGVAIGDTAAADESGLAIGENTVSHQKGVSVGAAANASESGVAVGESSNSTGTGGVAVGAGSSSGENSVAVGDLSKATISRSVAIGDKATTTFKSQLVIQTDSGSAIDPAANDYRINYNSTRKELFMVTGSNTNYNIQQGVVLMPNLPTEDPSNAGQLWNNDGTMKISSG